MKKVLIVFVSLLFASSMLTAKEKGAKKPSLKPCYKACKIERSKCYKDTKKSPKGERKAKFVACKKAYKDCRKECKKPKKMEGGK